MFLGERALTENPLVRIEQVSKTYSNQGHQLTILEDISLELQDGEFYCLLGLNGSGKTTLLRLIAGLDYPSRGHIEVGGRPVTGPGRDRGMVFQDLALFPWYTVRQNLEFPLRLAKLPSWEIDKQVEHYLKATGLEKFARAYPKELSGGMKQRLALGRALIGRPKIVLMDEPFASLDIQTRNAMQKFFLELWLQTRQTVIFVTHSVDEALFLADRVGALTRPPARIGWEQAITLPRPRDRTDPDLVAMRRELLAFLEAQAGSLKG